MSDHPIIVPGPMSAHMVTPAMLIPEDREVAWAGAKAHIRTAKDRTFVMGRFVHAGPPPNENGHLFRLEDLEGGHKLIPHTPLNIGHRHQHVVGAFVASELLYPTNTAGQQTNATTTVGNGQLVSDPNPATAYALSPWVETLSVMWKYAFPDEYETLKSAHDMGASFLSMECVPHHVTCPTCDHQTAWAGLSSDTYCDHMNTGRHDKWLEKPLFVGGALVLPPARPGWRDAQITEVAGLLDAHTDEANLVLAQIADVAPHLSVLEAETFMAVLLAGVFDERPEKAKVFAPMWERLTDGVTEKLTPPAGVQATARNALATVASTAERTVNPSTLARARGLASGTPRSTDTVAAMARFFETYNATNSNDLEYQLWGGDDGAAWVINILPEVTTAARTAMERRKMAGSGAAMADGSYPIGNAGELKSAISLFPAGEGNNGKTKASIKAHIVKRAKSLGLASMLPEGWT